MDKKYAFVGSMWPTSLNAADYTARRDAGEPLQLVFDDAQSALDHAMKRGWSPVIIEQIEVRS